LYQSGGVAIPTKIPLSFTASASGTITINNTGSTPFYADFEIKGIAQNPRVELITTGEYFYIDNSLGASDTVFIVQDSDGESVLLNNSINYIPYLKGRVFKIPLGFSTIRFSASAYDSSALLTVNFAPRGIRL